MSRKKSFYIEQAFKLLNKVEGKPLSLEERETQAIQLSSLIMKEAHNTIDPREKHFLKKFHHQLLNPQNRAFILSLTDQAFRPHCKKRALEQISDISIRYGIPSYFSILQKAAIITMRILGKLFPRFFINYYSQKVLKKITELVVIGNRGKITKYILQKKKENEVTNITEIGEISYGKKQARKFLERYLDNITNPHIEYVSIKISLLHPLFHPLAQDAIIHKIKESIALLLQAANKNYIYSANGEKKPTFICFEMDTHKYLDVTITLFKELLSQPEFMTTYAGITLQAYLPESFAIQQDLTKWAQERVENGGSPIKISLVKGTYLGEEQILASKKEWPQAPFLTKAQTDAHFKKMMIYGMVLENARAVHLGICTHNVFDISYALLLSKENQVSSYIDLEMLRGVAVFIRHVAQHFFSNKTIVFTPKIAADDAITKTIPYVIRRIDEATASENFSRFIPFLYPNTKYWEEAVSLFSESCHLIESLESTPRHNQDRNAPPKKIEKYMRFSNEPHTDFSKKENRIWAQKVIEKWKQMCPSPIALQIGGKHILSEEKAKGFNISVPDIPFYYYSQASAKNIDEAITCAKQNEKKWDNVPFAEKSQIIDQIGQNFRARRDDLIGALVTDVGKLFQEADAEVCDSIDTIEYYQLRMKKLLDLQDISWKSKGTFCVISSRSFPCSAPTSSIIAALITGNCVLFKPAPESALIAQQIMQAMWDAGVPKEVLQLILCSEEITSTSLIPDRRINSVILTGKADTAQKFLQINPSLDLTAITNGKNTMIITALADREQAIYELVDSAFGYSGQKYGSTSIAILEEEIYNDPTFLDNLKDVASSLIIGAPWDFHTQMPPLVNYPDPLIRKGLTQLEKGEKWLLQPTLSPTHPYLWSPGIKMGTTPTNFSFQTPYLGPILSLVRAKNFKHAIEIAATLPYGLTAGLQSLDPKEYYLWQKKIEVGNYYINRSMSGAMIRREPFGGIKKSAFGHSYKAGGPNFLNECMHAVQKSLPKEKQPVNQFVNNLTTLIEKLDLTAEQLGLWYGSVANYSFWWKRMRQFRDPTKIIGQDNLFGYLPKKKIVLRIEGKTSPLDSLRVIAAALTCKAALHISFDPNISSPINWQELSSYLTVFTETQEGFIARIKEENYELIRMTVPPSLQLKEAAAAAFVFIADSPVLANGRLELLHYLRECTISHEYERYGNLCTRDGELRKPTY